MNSLPLPFLCERSGDHRRRIPVRDVGWSLARSVHVSPFMALRGVRVDGTFTIPEVAVMEAVLRSGVLSNTGGCHSSRRARVPKAARLLKHSLDLPRTFGTSESPVAATSSNRLAALTGSDTGRTRFFLGAGSDLRVSTVVWVMSR